MVSHERPRRISTVDLTSPWTRFVVAAATISTCLKMLLIPAYHSTDFEVHRNWLAITHSTPICRWYEEATSEWTLDYPPFFAWFEYLLSHAAQFVDPNMLVVTNLKYHSKETVLFQRFSVIACDLLLYLAVWRLGSLFTPASKPRRHQEYILTKAGLFATLVVFQVGLIFVDHIHFQYNGLLFSIFLFSIDAFLRENLLPAAILYTILVNFKHLFLYVAPVYFVYYLRWYCFAKASDASFSSWQMRNFLKLAVSILVVFSISFGPFLQCGQMKQVLSRLFPFHRGLCHAYWAPNFWVIYNVAEKAITITKQSLGLLSHGARVANMTGGLVGEAAEFLSLPIITPSVTLLLTLLSLIVREYLSNFYLLFSVPISALGYIFCRQEKHHDAK
eukprot:TRINITY_DN7533_c0_g1_i2.p1 TRINITY_DN7533_c0_g1~~TRINITY_DN7533_c0_g1_i2.p1  ORF type:complete len:389 (+),score=59.73 TRINITY_DN7533_c0_g1_i2:60-1226(+)